MADIDIYYTESSAEWLYSWSTESGDHELAFVPGNAEWLKRFRAADPDTGERGGWANPLPIDLEVPTTREDSEAIARSYVSSLG